MNRDALIAGIICVTLLIGWGAWVTLRIFKELSRVCLVFDHAHEATLRSLERIHDRNTSQFSEMADRFMSLDFATFKTWQMAGEADVGGFEEPEDEGVVLRDNGRGLMVPVGADYEERLRAAANEQSLLSEDFPEGGDWEK